MIFSFRSTKWAKGSFYKEGGAFGLAFTAVSAAAAAVVDATVYHYRVGAFHSPLNGPIVHNPNSPFSEQ
jgi:hypothetical protein